MSGSKQHRLSHKTALFAAFYILSFHTLYAKLSASRLCNEGRNAFIKMKLASKLNYFIAHGIYYLRKTVCSNVRMCIS